MLDEKHPLSKKCNFFCIAPRDYLSFNIFDSEDRGAGTNDNSNAVEFLKVYLPNFIQ